MTMNVLVIDIGGNNVKILATGHKQRVKFPSGPTLTPSKMVAGVKKLAANWQYDVISIGVPGPVLLGELIMDPRNLGPGWVHFDFAAAFGVPVKLVNDAAMQALGSYRGGKMLFFGLGTGLGTALVINGVAESREVGQLPYKGGNLEDYVGARGMQKMGKRKWRKNVEEIVTTLLSKVQADDVVLGGGQVKNLKTLPEGCREGSNDNAFIGGFRLWEESPGATATAPNVLKLVPQAQKRAAKQSHGGGFRSGSFRQAGRKTAGHR
jgi:predicted NBD/HSP70 family sugar kinase